MIVVATSDGTGFLDNQGDTFTASLWASILDRWTEGMPPEETKVLARVGIGHLITTRDDEGWAVSGEWIPAEELDVTGWQSLPELPGQTASQ